MAGRMSYNFPRKPAFLTKCFNVSSLDHFYSAATSGKKVAEYSRPFSWASITIPCFPTSQSSAFFPDWKLTSKETPTFNVFTSSNVTGLKRSSCNADISAYFPRIDDSCAGSKVPMHPLSYSFIIHVTKMGTLGSARPWGKGGSGFLLSLAMRTSKQ